MADQIELIIDGDRVFVTKGTSVAAAVLQQGLPGMRRSVIGQRRGPLCGMGICFECRLTIDGRSQVRSCQTLCEPGMEVSTDG